MIYPETAVSGKDERAALTIGEIMLNHDAWPRRGIRITTGKSSAFWLFEHQLSGLTMSLDRHSFVDLRRLHRLHPHSPTRLLQDRAQQIPPLGRQACSATVGARLVYAKRLQLRWPLCHIVHKALSHVGNDTEGPV